MSDTKKIPAADVNAPEADMSIAELQDYVELGDAAVERAEQEADRRRAWLSRRKAEALMEAASEGSGNTQYLLSEWFPAAK